MITVYPRYISLKYWTATVVNDYSNECLPILTNEEEWEEWASIVASTGAFLRAGVPSPSSVKRGIKEKNFKDWEGWAKVVFNIMDAEDSNININN